MGDGCLMWSSAEPFKSAYYNLEFLYCVEEVEVENFSLCKITNEKLFTSCLLPSPFALCSVLLSLALPLSVYVWLCGSGPLFCSGSWVSLQYLASSGTASKQQ